MRRWTSAVVMATVALLSACSKHDEQVAGSAPERAPEYRAPMRTLPWLANFELGTAPDEHGVLTRLTNEFSPGEPIYLSMKVNEAPRGTVVTTYWYGPSNVTLGHETKNLSPDEERLRFVQDNTLDWQPGAYRAEIWIGNIKLKERHFKIVADDAQPKAS
jgi:hypothetical protein